MRTGEDVMFSKDRKQFEPARVVGFYPEAGAIKITRKDVLWTVREDEVFSLDDYARIGKEKFAEENSELIEAWNSDPGSKAKAARAVGQNYEKALRILKKAEGYKLLKEAPCKTK